MTVEELCARIPMLKRDRSGGVVKPYKPVLLAAVVMLIHKGKIRSPEILLDGALRSAFGQLMRLLFPDWPYTAKIEYPFRHLDPEVWTLRPKRGSDARLNAARADHAAAWNVLKHVECASLDPEVFTALATRFDARVRVLRALWDLEGMPLDCARKLLSLMLEPEQEEAQSLLAAEEEVFTERMFEEHLERNWAGTPFASMGVALSSTETFGLPGRQVLTSASSIDLLGFQPSERRWWVFELKRGKPNDAVVGQVLRYIGWMKGEYARKTESVVGAILTERSDGKLAKLKYAVTATPNLSLWTYDRAFEIRPAAG